MGFAPSNTISSGAPMSENPNAPAVTKDFEFLALQKANNYRMALIREFSPFLKGRVIEVGAGIGQLTGGLSSVPTVEELVSVEPDAKFCETFRRLHPGHRIVQGTVDALPTNSAWDTLVSINVLEHIYEDDTELARWRQKLVARGGYLCLFVPARPEIYAPIDRDFGHHRRYTRPQLRSKLERAGFSIIRLNYFNWVGYFAWWFNFRSLKKRHFDVGAVAFFDRVIFPVVYSLECNIVRPPFGQSLLAIARAEP